jgi:hypothetical protein
MAGRLTRNDIVSINAHIIDKRVNARRGLLDYVALASAATIKLQEFNTGRINLSVDKVIKYSELIIQFYCTRAN